MELWRRCLVAVASARGNRSARPPPLRLKRSAAAAAAATRARAGRPGGIVLAATAAAALSTQAAPAAAANMVTPLPPQRFTYALANADVAAAGSGAREGAAAPPRARPLVLYVPLTARGNALTLPSTRGPGFALPSAAVAALCRVRDAEAEFEGELDRELLEAAAAAATAPDPDLVEPPKKKKAATRPKWEPWCRWLDTVDGPQKLPPGLDPVARLEGEDDDCDCDAAGRRRLPRRRPTADELWEEILPRVRGGPAAEEVAFAGEGEPLLRLAALLDLAARVRSETGGRSAVRVATNGLLPVPPPPWLLASSAGESEEGVAAASAEVAAARRLAEAGVQCLSVALMTSDPDQYDDIMQPAGDDPKGRRAHERACDMVRAAVGAGLRVEITAVERPGVSKAGLERLASSAELLGPGAAAVPVRWRTYFG
jgi:hypothetical protein